MNNQTRPASWTLASLLTERLKIVKLGKLLENCPGGIRLVLSKSTMPRGGNQRGLLDGEIQQIENAWLSKEADLK
jgi:hypothetical protein